LYTLLLKNDSLYKDVFQVSTVANIQNLCFSTAFFAFPLVGVNPVFTGFPQTNKLLHPGSSFYPENPGQSRYECDFDWFSTVC
jgi:hypothetical protein